MDKGIGEEIMKPVQKDMPKLALVLLGANLPFEGVAPAETVRRAIADIQATGARLTAASPLYSTPCFPAGAGPDFINAAAAFEWDGSPRELLSALHRIEAEHGRTRDARWAARTLDLDLVALGSLVLPDEGTWRQWAGLDLATQMREAPDTLILPHPRMQDRGFVLRPLLDIAAEWVHPILGKSVRDMFSALDSGETDPIQRVSGAEMSN